MIKKLIIMASIILKVRNFVEEFYNFYINKGQRPTINKEFLGLITRCKDEYFVEEFCEYYLNEGVDQIIIVDDNSFDKSIYDNLLNHINITIIWEENIIENNFINKFYKTIKNKFEWIIYVDVDEFITTKRKNELSIRNEILTTFKLAHCIKIPWVMMSCNNIKNSPDSILQSITHRWDHDKKHRSNIPKFRCRYDKIEVKCIFKPAYFNDVFDHHPRRPVIDDLNVVNSIDKSVSTLDSWHHNLREIDIKEGIMVCYHYRMISQENNQKKLEQNYWYIKDGYTHDDLMSSDHPEIVDFTLKKKRTYFK